MLSEVYDIEDLSNLFTYTGYCRQTGEYYQFVIHSSLNQYEELMKHLFRDKLIMIGFNNDNYDYPIIHHMINHYEEYKYLSGLELAQKIYEKSQEIINMEFSSVAEWNKHIKQIDLYKIWHFDNAAKRTSLKALQIALNLLTVEDSPFEHWYWVNKEEIPQVLKYNKNDVYSTNVFLDVTLGNTELPLYKGKNKIELRQKISQKYKINCLNFNDIKLGTELILKLYCEKFNRNPQVIRNQRTFRKIFNLSECIPIWTKFESKEFQKLVTDFCKINIYNGETKKVFSASVIFHGIKIDYGTGGAHASIKPGVYSSDNDWLILDLDVDGLYPRLAITQGLYPQHLGPGFIDIYDGEIVSVRITEKKKPKKERDFVIVEGFKLAANGFFGKSNSDDSFAYDPLYAMKTTISGQILLSMWVEKLVEASPTSQIIQVNTDGITIRILKEDYDKCIEVTEKLMSETNMTYESNIYKRMVIQDVNNYSAEYEIGGFKYKGLFEIDKELHKDPSMRIVPIALSKYFFESIPIKETIIKHQNIYDFCLRMKINKGWEGQYNYISQNKLNIQKLSKNTRYYVSNKGGTLCKYNPEDKRIIGVSVGSVTTLFNEFEEKDNYDINYNFYINECRKIVDSIENKQLFLF
jgi:hypothetical protein